MSSWGDITQFGVSTTPNNKNLLKQLMECVGVDFSQEYESETEEIYSEFYSHNDLSGIIDGCFSGEEEFFYLANILFKNTYVYYAYEMGHTGLDSSRRDEVIFDPVKGKQFVGTYNCYMGEPIVNGMSRYEIFKDKCEEAAKTKSVKIEWKNEWGFIEPGNDKFYKLCCKVLDKEPWLTTEKEEFPIDVNGYDKKHFKKYLDGIIETATEKGYTELTALILEKCHAILATDS